MMGFGLGLGIIWMILFWGGLVMLAIWLVGKLFPTGAPQSDPGIPSTSSALEILNARYARGELTTEQYQEMLKTLQQ